MDAHSRERLAAGGRDFVPLLGHVSIPVPLADVARGALNRVLHPAEYGRPTSSDFRVLVALDDTLYHALAFGEDAEAN